MSSEPIVRHLGTVGYGDALASMGEFTDTRDSHTPDEIWCLEHPPVFTLGLNANRDHLVAPGDIDVVQVDRGGQVTYHGPGQLVIYTLLDLRRRQLGIRDLVCALEQAVIDAVRPFGITAIGRRDAPGVYVDGAKLASVGLRVRRGSSYHGLAVNVDMDLEPFSRINPCGMAGLPVTDLARLGRQTTPVEFAGALVPALLRALG